METLIFKFFKFHFLQSYLYISADRYVVIGVTYLEYNDFTRKQFFMYFYTLILNNDVITYRIV